VRRIDCCHHAGEARLANPCQEVSNLGLLLSLFALVLVVPVRHMCLQVSRAEICSPAAIVSISAASLCAEENVSKPGLLYSGDFIAASWANTLLLLGTSQAEDVLARDHPAVDEDGLETFVTTVDHRVHDLFPNQVHFVVPVKGQHRGWVASIYRGESRCFHLTNVSFHVILWQSTCHLHSIKFLL